VRGGTAARVPNVFRKSDVAVKDLTRVIAMKDARPHTVPDAVMPTVYLSLGLAYKNAGQPATARATWEKAEEPVPDGAGGGRHRARAAESLSDDALREARRS
jgi:Tfp pilus assembly protein PilF